MEKTPPLKPSHRIRQDIEVRKNRLQPGIFERLGGLEQTAFEILHTHPDYFWLMNLLEYENQIGCAGKKDAAPEI